MAGKVLAYDSKTLGSAKGAYIYGEKSLAKGRLLANDDGTTKNLVDDQGNKIKFFSIVEV